MEHHHDSYTQTQRQTPLGDHTIAHHDKKLESPTCTDFANNLENLQLESTLDTYALGERSLDETYSYNNYQLPVELDTDKTSLGQQHEPIKDGDDQQVPPPPPPSLNHLAEMSLERPGDIDETVDEDALGPSTGHDNQGDDHSSVSEMGDSTMVAAEITIESNNTQQHEQPSSENNGTTSTETENDDCLDTNKTSSVASSDGIAPLTAATNEHHVNIDSLGTATHLVGMDPSDTNDDTINNHDDDDEIDDSGIQQQVDTVDQLNTNMTSGDDKGNDDNNCIMNQSVDHVDAAYSCHRANSPPASGEMDRSTESSFSATANQKLDPAHQNDTLSIDLPSQHQSSTDNSSDRLDHTMTSTVYSTINTSETPAASSSLSITITSASSVSSASSQHGTSPRGLEQNDTMSANGQDGNDGVDQQQQHPENVHLDGDEHILDNARVVVQQQDEGNDNILQFISTIPETTASTSAGSISTEQQLPSHHISDDQALNRMNTTGSDEHTLAETPRSRHVWESDRQASECRRCSRRFSFLVRRHHCRRCGQIVCDRCSSHRVRLPVEEIVEDPLISTSHYPMIALNPQRVCESCIRIPIKVTESTSSRYSSSQNNHHHYHHASQSTMGHPRLRPMNMERTDSQQSLMADCPVCGTGLLGMGKQQQEHHLNQCLNTGSPTVQPPRYIIYTLTEGTTQLGDECPICFEEFEVGDKIARMVCLCSYHRHCLRDWLERGKGCPIHYDSNFGAY